MEAILIMLPNILISDLHLTDKPEDSFRFNIFNIVKETALPFSHYTLTILGDITEKKDKHTAGLVNTILNHLFSLFNDNKLLSIKILTGNHDFIDRAKPYFNFLNHHVKIQFITEPLEQHNTRSNETILYLPYSSNPMEEWKKFTGPYSYVFMHQSVQGGQTQSGYIIDAKLPANYFVKKAKKVYSGDLHVPQTIENITYVGAPYHIYFGDTYTGSIMILTQKESRIQTGQRFPKKHHLIITNQDFNPLNIIQPGDQVKITVKLDPAEFSNYKEIKETIKKKITSCRGHLFGIGMVSTKQRTGIATTKDTKIKRTPKEWLKVYAARQGLSLDQINGGIKIIGGHYV